MITTLNTTNRFAGLSTDQKPTVGVANGSKFIEIDTGKKYLYNAAGEAWVEYTGGGGGGEDNLPTPTADNVGKSLTVIATPADGEVIVPEQTVNCVEVGEVSPMATLADVAQELFVNGETIIVTFDDSSIEMTIEEWQIGGVETYGFIIVTELDDIENVTKFNLYTYEAGEHTIKVVQKQARTFDVVIPEQEITVEDPSTPVSLTADEYPIAVGDVVLFEMIDGDYVDKCYAVIIDEEGHIETDAETYDRYGFMVCFYDGNTWVAEYTGFEGTYKVKASKVIYQYIYSYGFDGSGLPTPTLADNGKAVVVSAQQTEGAVIVPEQTVYTSGQEGDLDVPVSDADASAFVDGTNVIATIDGVEYNGTMSEGGDGAVGVGFADFDYYFFNDNGTVKFGSAIEGTHTVKLCVASTTYSYGFGVRGLKVTASKGVIYDDGYIVFDDDDMTLDKTWAEISSAVESGVPVYLVADINGLQDTEARAIWQLQSYGFRTNEYMVTFTIASQSGASTATFVASTPDGTLMP